MRLLKILAGETCLLDEHHGLKPRSRGVGGHAGRVVAGRGQADRAAARFQRLEHAQRRAPVLEGKGRALLHLEIKARHAPPGAVTVGGQKRGFRLAEAHPVDERLVPDGQDGPPLAQEGSAVGRGQGAAERLAQRSLGKRNPEGRSAIGARQRAFRFGKPLAAVAADKPQTFCVHGHPPDGTRERRARRTRHAFRLRHPFSVACRQYVNKNAFCQESVDKNSRQNKKRTLSL